MANQPLKRYDTGTSSWVGVAAGSVSDGTTEYGVEQVGLSSMTRQALINGNFDVWQRGTSKSGVSGYLADRWKLDTTISVTNITQSRQNLTSAESDLYPGAFFYRIANTAAIAAPSGNQILCLDQAIENGVRNLCGTGKKVSVSFWARSTISGKKMGLFLIQNYGTGGSPSLSENVVGSTVTLTTSWQKYNVVINTNSVSSKTFGTNNDDFLTFYFSFVHSGTWATAAGGSAEGFGIGNIDIRMVSVNAGDTPMPYQPRSYEEEVGLCRRYYLIKSGKLLGVLGNDSTTKRSFFFEPFPRHMRVAPTITTTISNVTTEWEGVANYGSPDSIIANNVDNDGAYIEIRDSGYPTPSVTSGPVALIGTRTYDAEY